MKKLGYILLMIMLSCTAMAQKRQNAERIHAIKVGFLTDKVQLSTEQATKFWPVYNRYEDELITLRHSYFRKYPKKEERDEAASRKYIEDNLEYQETELHLKRKYKNEFLKIISAQQLAQLYDAEREFKKMLIRQLREQRAAGADGNAQKH